MAEWIIEIKDGKFPIGKWSLLVRCKDCKWFEHGTTCIRFGIRMSRAHDDFCSYGKEKDNGENRLD